MAQFNKNTQELITSNKSLYEVVMLADASGRPRSEFGGPLANIGISAGLIDGYSSTHKFGAVPLMSSNPGFGSVWDKNDTLYPWSAWDTHGTLTVATYAANGSLSTADNGGTLTVYGLDTNFEVQEEDIAISGSAGTGVKTFSRIWRAYFTPASGTANATRISVSRGGTEVLRINIGKSQTLMAQYTIPAGKTGFMVRKSSSVQGSGHATVEMYTRYGGTGAFRVQDTAQVNGPGGQHVAEFIIPLAYPEKTDVDFRAYDVSNNARITASFDIIMIDNTLLAQYA